MWMRFVNQLIGLAFGAIVIASAYAAQTAPRGSVQRMYVLECGEATTHDVSANWSPGVNVGMSRDFSDNCYLIKHANGWMLWDSGMADSIADKPNGVSAAGGLLTLRVRKTLAAQLRQLEIEPDQIERIAFSHFHGDHVGNANLFTKATLYIQQAEYDAAFGPDAAKLGFQSALYDKLQNNPVTKLHGDHDVFGDGSVVILATPGHTPGHQSLLVRLPRRGAVVLSGDMVHFRENWEQRRVPKRNYDARESEQSMARIAALLTTEHAELWINHDRAQSDTIPKAPNFVE